MQVQGSLAGDQGTFTIDGSASLELSNGGAAPVIFDGGSATLKLDAPAAFTGAIEEVVVGDAIDLAGITASSATYSGTTLTINETNGQQLIYSVSGSLTGDAVTVASDNNGGTLVYWGAAPAATSQYWITGASGDWSDAADWESGSVPTSTDGAVITNSSGVTVNGTAAAYSLTLDGSYLTVSGTLTLGTSLTVDDYARLTLSGGTLSAQSISSTSGGDFYGYGTVGGAVNGAVYITAAGGALQVQGSLAGDQGTFTIDGSASLELSNGGAAPVIFDGGSATLKLDAPAAFTGAIEEVVVGDAIDLAGITASSATYSGSTLTINETNGQQLIYSNVSGSLTGDAVTVASDNNGGTLVYWMPIPASESWNGATADWNTPTDWSDNVVPNDTLTDATLGGVGAYTVTIGQGETFTTGAVLLDDADATFTIIGALAPTTLTVDAGSLMLTGLIQGTGTLSLTGGQTAFDSGATLTIGSVSDIWNGNDGDDQREPQLCGKPQRRGRLDAEHRQRRHTDADRDVESCRDGERGGDAGAGGRERDDRQRSDVFGCERFDIWNGNDGDGQREPRLCGKPRRRGRLDAEHRKQRHPDADGDVEPDRDGERGGDAGAGGRPDGVRQRSDADDWERFGIWNGNGGDGQREPELCGKPQRRRRLDAEHRQRRHTDADGGVESCRDGERRGHAVARGRPDGVRQRRENFGRRLVDLGRGNRRDAGRGAHLCESLQRGSRRDGDPDRRKSHTDWQREPRRRDRERLALAQDERNDDSLRRDDRRDGGMG